MPPAAGTSGRTRPRRPRRSRRRSAAGTAPPGHAGRPPGRRPGRAAWARWTARNPARRAGGPRHAAAAGAAHFVQVMLDPLRRRRDLLLLIRPRHAQVSGVRQVPAAGAPALRVMVLGPVPDLHTSPHPGCPAASPVPLPVRSFRGPPLLARQLPPWLVVRRRRHRGVPAVRATPPAPPRLKPLPQGQRPAPPALRSAPPAPRSAHHADPRMAPSGGGASVTARNDPGNHASHRGNSAPAAKT